MKRILFLTLLFCLLPYSVRGQDAMKVTVFPPAHWNDFNRDTTGNYPDNVLIIYGGEGGWLGLRHPDSHLVSIGTVRRMIDSALVHRDSVELEREAQMDTVRYEYIISSGGTGHGIRIDGNAKGRGVPSSVYKYNWNTYTYKSKCPGCGDIGVHIKKGGAPTTITPCNQCAAMGVEAVPYNPPDENRVICKNCGGNTWQLTTCKTCGKVQ